MKYAGTYSIYKKSAAAQFTLLPVRRDENGRVRKNGAVLAEFSKAIGEKSYDWKSKITFAFGMNDLSQFFNSDNPGKFIHKTDTATKILEFTPGEGRYEGTFMLRISESGETKNSVSISLSAGEFVILSRLFAYAIPKMIAWDID